MVGRMDGAVLPTILNLKLESITPGHQAFEFFKPIEEDVDLGSVWMWRAISRFTQ